ncbi:MAG: hypothetical protein WC337_07720 [Candidatus Muiribacteriota bacterium]|jgi:chemotaxis protein histidine kinase CheA
MNHEFNKNLIKKFTISLKEKLLILSADLCLIKKTEELEVFSLKCSSSLHTLKGGAAFLGLKEYTEFFFQLQQVFNRIEENIYLVKFKDVKNLYGYIIGLILDDIKHWKIDRLNNMVDDVLSSKKTSKIKNSNRYSNYLKRNNRNAHSELEKMVIEMDNKIKNKQVKIPECVLSDWDDIIKSVKLN